MAYMINGTEGASKTPSALALVMSPIPLCSGYPRDRSIGSKMPPRARRVTPLPPVSAVNAEQSTAEAATLALQPPPPIKLINSLKRLAAVLFAKSSPASVYRGSAGREGLTVIAYCDSGIEASG